MSINCMARKDGQTNNLSSYIQGYIYIMQNTMVCVYGCWGKNEKLRFREKNVNRERKEGEDCFKMEYFLYIYAFPTV